MGCGTTLFLGSGGYVTCSRASCPRPDATASILEDGEYEHLVEIGETGFTVRHPLRERLDDQLLRCDLHARLAAAAGPPHRPGRYRVYEMADADRPWSFVRLDDPPAGG
jgi:hypothetical protein